MFVFGIDIPLPELMAFVFGIQGIALVLIYMEIRKFSKLFHMGKFEMKELNIDISKLGRDINYLTYDIKLLDFLIKRDPMVVIANYVTHQLKQGKSRHKLRITLKHAGFKDSIIKEAFDKVKT